MITENCFRPMWAAKRIKKAMQITRDYKADLETHKEVIREQESQIAEKDEYILKANMEYTYYAESLIKEIAKQKKQIATLTGQLEVMEYTTIQGGIIGAQKERIAALEAERDRLLLSPSDPKSGWQGINKEVKVWQEKAEHITTLINDNERAEKVIRKQSDHEYWRMFRIAIGEYRAMLKAEIDTITMEGGK